MSYCHFFAARSVYGGYIDGIGSEYRVSNYRVDEDEAEEQEKQGTIEEYYN